MAASQTFFLTVNYHQVESELDIRVWISSPYARHYYTVSACYRSLLEKNLQFGPQKLFERSVDGRYLATMDWHDKSISLFAVIISMIILPLIVVPLRCYIRITRRAFKIDDWLIIAALIFHLGACAVTLWGFMYGLGMPDKVLSPENQVKGVQVYMKQASAIPRTGS